MADSFCLGSEVLIPFYNPSDAPLDTKTVCWSINQVKSLPKEARYIGLTIFVQELKKYYYFRDGIEDVNFIEIGSMKLEKVTNYASLPITNQDSNTIYITLDTMMEYIWINNGWFAIKNSADNITFNNNPSGTVIYPTDYKTVQKVLEQNKKEVDLKVDKTSIVDNLTTTDTTKVLSANMGKTLNDNSNAIDAKIINHINDKNNPHVTTKAQVGLSNVDNVQQIPMSQRGVGNGVATLDVNGLVPSTQLPSYVDDVLEFVNLASFPITGETGKIYVDKSTNKTYRWSGSVYIYITSGAVDSVNGKTGVITLTKADFNDLNLVDNTKDIDKPISTATQTTLNTKVDKINGKSLIDDIQITRLAGMYDFATCTTESLINGSIVVNGVIKPVYTHPVNHPATMITQDSLNRFVSDTEKTIWNAKADKTYVDSGLAKKPEISDAVVGTTNVFSGYETTRLYNLAKSNTTSAINDLKGGVATDGDTLAKLRGLISGIDGINLLLNEW